MPSLNPQDTESMGILKDPSSLAIFGAQASNGAVISKKQSSQGFFHETGIAFAL
jgi:TonB-dependent SusC/RagA subfamily outer membrane receptor